jgi:hypothetical protein
LCFWNFRELGLTASHEASLESVRGVAKTARLGALCPKGREAASAASKNLTEAPLIWEDGKSKYFTGKKMNRTRDRVHGRCFEAVFFSRAKAYDVFASRSPLGETTSADLKTPKNRAEFLF